MGNCFWKIMGNCFSSPTSDDISLLRGSNERMGPRDSTISDHLGPPPPYVSHEDEDHAYMYFPSPNVSRPASQLTEEEQIRIAKRIGLIQHLPSGVYDGSKKIRECVICMIEFVVGDHVRYLPCMHTYHVDCIDDWLMRSLTCPSCMEPVESALLTSYETN
ncbi:unnamed protein product [Darwinula stevensoni]|uniref:RING-type domain-containing protein n=1 Tax=Darwinula stevensoni TaxID=69355 RepID=A0A7R9FPD8_9CRUS|nr:unnamed protein product [Darwinula stevensoni]CAG0897787.1 unnamed protein product [Darwinula stevensoni]